LPIRNKMPILALFLYDFSINHPSLLWHCWLDDRK